MIANGRSTKAVHLSGEFKNKASSQSRIVPLSHVACHLFSPILSYGRLSYTKFPCPVLGEYYTFANGVELREGFQYWFNFYNKERFHQSLDNLTPDEVYYDLPHPFAKAV